MGGAELLVRPVGPLDPVAADRAGRATRHPVGRHAAVTGENGSGHRLAEANAADNSIAAAMPADAAGATTDGETVDEDGKAPFQHLGIGEARVGHVRVDGVSAVEIRTGARAAADRLVILVALVAESEVVHR